MRDLSNSNRYPDDWNERRRSIYRRDNYECQKCGKGGGPLGDIELHCHHKTPISQGGSHKMENLITLCRDCHSAKHDHRIGNKTDRTSEPIPIPEDDVPASKQVINEKGETLEEFVQRFSQKQSESGISHSTTDPQVYNTDHQRVNCPEESEWFDDTTKSESSETEQNDSRIRTFLLNRIVGLIGGILMATLVVFLAPPIFELTSWTSVIVIGIITSLLYP